MPQTTSTTESPAWADLSGFSGVDILRQPSVSLDLDQRAQLAEVAERVRAVHELILACADRYAVFPVDFAAAQTREVVALEALLRRYGLPGHGVTVPHGLSTAAPRADCDQLLARGGASRSEALAAVAEALHRVLAELDTALPRLRAPDVHQACSQVYAATLHQLRVVREWSPR